MALREAERWRHLRPRPAAPDRFAGLLGVPALDAFLRTDAARAPRLSMADGARDGSAAVPEAEWAHPDGAADLPRLFARHDSGATLVVSGFQEVHPPLAALCRGLEQLFLHPVQANVYRTPPGARGFRPHWDTHDVLVLQVEGAKRWRIWDAPGMPRASRATPWAGGVAPAGEPRAVTLRAGEALYVPRGVMHEAEAQGRGGPGGGRASLHVTVGLLEPSWAEALRRLLDALEPGSEALRAAFPSWRLGGPDALDRIARGAAEALSVLGGDAAREALLLDAPDRLARERAAMPARGLEAPRITPRTRLRLGAALHRHVAAGPERAELRWAGGAVTLSAMELGWVERLDGEGVTAEELGAGALGFCQRLAEAGLVEVDPKVDRTAETERYFTARAPRADLDRAKEILARAGVGRAPEPGDEIPPDVAERLASRGV